MVSHEVTLSRFNEPKVIIDQVLDFTRAITLNLYQGIDPKLAHFSLSYNRFTYVVQGILIKIDHEMNLIDNGEPIRVFQKDLKVDGTIPGYGQLGFSLHMTNTTSRSIPLPLLFSIIGDGINYHKARLALHPDLPLMMEVLKLSTELLNEIVSESLSDESELASTVPDQLTGGVAVRIKVSSPPAITSPDTT